MKIVLTWILFKSLACNDNVSLKFSSLKFRIRKSDWASVNISYVIIDYWTFMIQCNHSCFQSFNFNFFFWYLHWKLMLLITQLIYNFISLHIHKINSVSPFFWALCWTSCLWSWHLNFILFYNKLTYLFNFRVFKS